MLSLIIDLTDKKDLNNWDSKLSYQEEVIKDVQ